MKKNLFSLLLLIFTVNSYGQLSPAITSWLQNTTETGTYYAEGNSMVISNGILYNCQLIEYSDDFVYVHTKGIPAYPTGPFLDNNPFQASDQDAIYKFPLNPIASNANGNGTRPGNNGAFINGVSLFDYRDGVAWNPNTNALCGGPGNPACPAGQSDWNRDAVPAERDGFDCSKAHPAMGNYHHHQNPSAFKLDLNVTSEVCNLYDADGLYAIDPNTHSPLIGYAYDGFPIYGAYGFQNSDGTGGIVRIKSGYQLRDITTRTTHADGETVSQGPDVNSTYFLGYFREDYEFNTNPLEDYLDEHNGRFCVTPEYPDGTYAYFATVNADYTSVYPYVIGPTYYGEYENRKVDAVNEATTVYNPIIDNTTTAQLDNLDISIFPNPAIDIIAIQMNGLVKHEITIELLDQSGKLISNSKIEKGSTIAYFDVQTVYEGVYFLKFSLGNEVVTRKILVSK